MKTQPHILIAEEDAFLGKIYKKKLEEFGYKVTIVDNGESCIREVQKKNPRLLVMDILLPRVDGFQVIETIKKNTKTEHIPIVVFTHLGQKEDVKKALSLGASTYLLKSHGKPEDLLAKIQEMLEK
jgi:CheY-like chemotaxis protein